MINIEHLKPTEAHTGVQKPNELRVDQEAEIRSMNRHYWTETGA